MFTFINIDKGFVDTFALKDTSKQLGSAIFVASSSIKTTQEYDDIQTLPGDVGGTMLSFFVSHFVEPYRATINNIWVNHFDSGDTNVTIDKDGFEVGVNVGKSQSLCASSRKTIFGACT